MFKDLIPYFFGVEAAILYDYTTKQPLGFFQIVSEGSLDRTVEGVALEGGSGSGAYAIEDGQPSNALSLTVRELPNFAFKALENANITKRGAEAEGYISALKNSNGESVFDASVGLASVIVKETVKQNLPFGRIIIEAVGTDTVSIKVAGKLAQGPGQYLNYDAYVKENIVISAATTDIDELGITLTKGSGTTAFVHGDIAYCDVRPVNFGSSTIQVGANADTKTFGLMIVYPKNKEGQITYIDFPKVSGAGIPLGFSSRAFSDIALSLTPLVDPCRGGILYELGRVDTLQKAC